MTDNTKTVMLEISNNVKAMIIAIVEDDENNVYRTNLRQVIVDTDMLKKKRISLVK